MHLFSKIKKYLPFINRNTYDKNFQNIITWTDVLSEKTINSYFIALVALMLLIRIRLIFSYSLDLDGAEFTFVHYIQQMLSGKDLYMNPEEYPFSAVIYTPLYIYIVTGICKLLNFDDIQDIHNIYVIGRICSFLFVLLCIYTLWLFIKRCNGNQLQQSGIICLFLALVTGHLYTTRPDSMKIAFFILYLYNYVVYFFYERKIKYLIGGCLFALLSIATKQDAIIYILLFQSILLFHLKSKEILIINILITASVTLLFIFFYFIFGTVCIVSLFYFNIQIIGELIFSYNYLVIALAIVRHTPLLFCLLYIIDRTEKRNIGSILSINGVFAFAISTFFLLRPGAYLNYTYEMLIFSILSIIVYINQIQSTIEIRKFLTGLVMYGCFILLLNPIMKNYIPFLSDKKYQKQYTQLMKIRTQILPYLENNEILFTPDLSLSLFFADKNVIYGHEYHLDRLIDVHLQLASSSNLLLVSSKKYDDYFKNKEVQYILMEKKENTSKIVQTTYPDYTAYIDLDKYILYKARE